MSEKVIVSQNSRFESKISALDLESGDMRAVKEINDLTPYGMLLAGLGLCTASTLHTYAQHHGTDLKGVELQLSYERVYANDCRDCEDITEYKEQIDKEVKLIGSLTEKECRKLLKVSRHCPVQKVLEHGIDVESRIEE